MFSLKSLSSSITAKKIIQLQCRTASTKIPGIPINNLKDTFSASAQTENGHIYDKKPFKMSLNTGRTYKWCLCGRSRNQPFCDGTHKDIYWKIKQRPVFFQVPETKEYWLCNCKQTKNRPFCDGTHKRQDVQEFPVKV